MLAGATVNGMADIAEQDIPGVLLITPTAHGDERGRFVETYRREWFAEAPEMIQGNRSEKQAGALVGLHFHRFQADYWYVLRGIARVGLADLRAGSPTEGTAMTIDLDGNKDQGLYIPRGVAHGFAALTDLLLTYLVDGYYNPDDELGVAFDDPAFGIDWGISDPITSERDKRNPRFADLDDAIRPQWPAS